MTPRRGGRFVAALGGLAVLGVLSACSDLNPSRLFGAEESAPPPGAEAEFPNLATVPETPRKSSSPEDIRKVKEGLVADRERARYTDEALRSNAVDEVDFAASARAAKARAELLAAKAAEAEAKAEPAPVEPKTEAAPVEPVVAVPVKPVEVEPLPAVQTEPVEASAPIENPAKTVLRFDAGSSELSNEAIERLHQVANQLKKSGGSLRVTGHAAGPVDKKAILAQDRALVVAAELSRLGVETGRVRLVEAAPADDIAEDWVDVVIKP